VAPGGRHAQLGRGLQDPALLLGVVDAEGVAGHDHLGPLPEQPADRGADAVRRRRAPVEERVEGLQAATGAELEGVHRRSPPGEKAFEHPRAHAEDPHRRHVAFEKRVRRLGRAVGEERHGARVDAEARQRSPQHLDHAPGDPLGGVVRRQDRRLAPDLVGGVVEHDRLREGPADVDADPDSHRGVSARA